ncbi:hypothetical protein GCM10010503_61430 [Streptomyces lucensis JCM 4490]|uniref:DUF6924 domain-containing protein n=1 Tax=Streptomyces lucensis JCM 4490 TaxID=1306176 RepID=A0A918JDS6_9ACTN|nr:hypothetical protein [Streptomyces lucensis]GGW75473.1 hypothetical protein GCM10010503_61430 [Streptomyces lucensis JCM 4490]
MALPGEGEFSLVLRADFRDDAAWRAVCAEIDAAEEYSTATFVSDPRFAGVTVQALLDEEAAAAEEDKVFHVFLADAVTMTDAEHRLLAVDLADEPGRTFRVPPRWFPDVSVNLGIANMDFAEYADEVDGTGTYRGFGGED